MSHQGSGRAPGRDRSGPHELAAFAGKRETRRNLALASIGGAVVVGAFSFMWFGARTLRDRAPASSSGDNRPDVTRFAALTPVQMTVSKGFDGFAEFAPDGSSVAFSSDRSGSMEIFVQGLASGSSPQQLTANGRLNVQPSWSGDGQFLAYCELGGGGIWIIPSRGGTPRRLLTLAHMRDGPLMAGESCSRNGH